MTITLLSLLSLTLSLSPLTAQSPIASAPDASSRPQVDLPYPASPSHVLGRGRIILIEDGRPHGCITPDGLASRKAPKGVSIGCGAFALLAQGGPNLDAIALREEKTGRQCEVDAGVFSCKDAAPVDDLGLKGKLARDRGGPPRFFIGNADSRGTNWAFVGREVGGKKVEIYDSRELANKKKSSNKKGSGVGGATLRLAWDPEEKYQVSEGLNWS